MKSLRYPTILLTVLTLLSLVSLGFGMGFMMHGDGSMSGCPFATGQMSMCPMTLDSHVSQWFSHLTAVEQSHIPLLLLAVLLVVTLAARILTRQIFNPPQQQIFRRLFSEHNPLGKIFSNFPELFSSGILHPKIFSAGAS